MMFRFNVGVLPCSVDCPLLGIVLVAADATLLFEIVGEELVVFPQVVKSEDNNRATRPTITIKAIFLIGRSGIFGCENGDRSMFPSGFFP